MAPRTRRQHGLETRGARLGLFDDILGPMMESYAENFVGRAEKKLEQALLEAKRIDESVCPTCKEPRHPKSTVCWRCAHEGMRKSYSANTEAYAKLQSYLRTQRVIVQLAVNTLGRAARQKKKGPFVRQARAILEAALAEPEPGGLSVSLAMKLGLAGTLAIGGILAYAVFGQAYARSKMGAWGSTADVGPPPTAEELAASP
jgi:ribosomal protein L37AE/L43A